MNTLLKVKLHIILLVSLFATAFAQDVQSPLVVSLTPYIVSVVTLEDGSLEEQLLPVETVSPGDVIEYELQVQNTTSAVLNGVQVVGPIPQQTVYLALSASDLPWATLEFSAPGFVAENGSEFAPAPLLITVVDELGNDKEVEILPKFYNAMRWTLLDGLAAGESRILTYRVEVQ